MKISLSLLVTGFLIGILGSGIPTAQVKTNSSKEEDHTDRAERNSEKMPRLEETVVVTAARGRESIGQAVSLVTAIPGEIIRDSAPLVLDDYLRQVPGFSLFRRNSSLTAHPTTQGVSLRGIGPSGTSRSLVLFDGIPMNDPFGGWVYWNRLPRSALDQVEVARGASSQLYGSSALGGAIQLLSRKPGDRTIYLTALGGQSRTADLEALFADVKGAWSFLAGGRLFDTDGSFVIDKSQRGLVDTPVSTRFGSFLGKASYKDLQVSLNLYAEDRGNGTRLQENSSELFQLAGGIHRANWWSDVYVQGGVLRSQFTRVLPGRNAEIITSRQRFESSAVGASAGLRLTDNLQLGSDWRSVGWDDRRQNLWGLFLQKKQRLHRKVHLQLAARLDLWENEQARWALSPKIGLLAEASDTATFRISTYRGFRAPTLNELYRPFRVGNVITEANSSLGAESLWGLEGGIDLHPRHNLLLRLNAFWNRLQDPIGNATLSVEENLIFRQRQNLDRVRVQGLEFDAVWVWTDRWSVEAGYLLSDSQVRRTGLRLPQVPVHQGSVGLRFDGQLLFRLLTRATSSQFEDDLNDFRLGGFGLVDLLVGRDVSDYFELFFAADNILDKRFVTGRVPEERLGESRLVYGGLRIRIGE